MSSMSSRPMDRRTRSSDTPLDNCCSSVSCWCVVVVGWMASDLASPTFARARRAQRFDEAPPRLTPALDAEGEDSAGALRQVLLRQVVRRVAGQAG